MCVCVCTDLLVFGFFMLSLFVTRLVLSLHALTLLVMLSLFTTLDRPACCGDGVGMRVKVKVRGEA